MTTSTTVQTKLLGRIGAKPIVMTGMTLGLAAMIWFTGLQAGGSYATEVLPGLLIAGVGMGCIFAPAFGTATVGVDRSEAGVASAMVNTSQQVGGAIGTALLSTLFASAVTDYRADHRGSQGVDAAATVHGYTTSFWWAALIFAVGLVVVTLVLPNRISQPQGEPAAEPAAA